MSIEVMTLVFKRYPNGGGEMLLALALADHSNDCGENIYPSVVTLAKKTRQSERTVQYQLRKMEESGWLHLVASENGGRGKSREYRINPDWIKGADFAPIKRVQSTTVKGASDDIKGATGNTKGATAIAPEPSTIINKAIVKEATITLPDWLPEKSLSDFKAHRKAMKKPMTEQAEALLIVELEKLRDAGHDPIYCLNEAILNGWQKPYAPKQQRATNRAEQLQQHNEQVAKEFLGGQTIEGEATHA